MVTIIVRMLQMSACAAKMANYFEAFM